MNKEVISNKQGISMVIMFILGSSLFFATGIEAKKDIWLAIIIGMILASLVLLMYSRILYLFPGKDLFDILDVVFGKYLGKIFHIAYILFALYLGAMVLRNFGEFINTVGLTQTPRVVPEIFYIFLCIWIVKLGVESLGRWSEIFILFIIIFLIFIALVETYSMNVDYLRPVFYNGISPIIKGVTNVIAFPLCESVVFMMIFSCLKTKKSPYKVYLIGLLIGGLILLIMALSTLMVIGADEVSMRYFPHYAAARRISIGDFIQRIEATLAAITLFTGFVKISVCLLAAANGTAKLFKCSDYRFIVFPLGLLTLNLSTLSYKNIMEMLEWGGSVWKFYALPFEVLIPFIILIISECKNRKKKLKVS